MLTELGQLLCLLDLLKILQMCFEEISTILTEMNLQEIKCWNGTE